jgi:hypothetical protein
MDLLFSTQIIIFRPFYRNEIANCCVAKEDKQNLKHVSDIGPLQALLSV